MRSAAALLAAGLAAAALLLAPSASAQLTVLTQWGSQGAGDGQFQDVGFLAVDPSGSVYVADGGNQRVQKFSNNGAFLLKWATASMAGIGIDPSSNVVVGLRLATPRIDSYTPDGQPRGTFREVPENVYSIDVDPQGNVFVFTGDGTPGEIMKKFDAAGNLVAQWGSFTRDDGNFSAGGGYDVATDSQGNVFVSDAGLGRIQKFGPTGQLITGWGSRGTGDGQFAEAGGPAGIGVDANDNVWAADTLNSRIQEFTSSGVFVQKFGTPGRETGQFDRPNDVAVDSAGNVFVLDSGNARVVKVGEAPQPVLGRAMAAQVVSGTVLVKLPGTTTFVALAEGVSLPVGTIVDARRGRVRITATSGGKTYSAEFFQGQFQIAQKKRKGATADMRLFGGSFKRCPRGLRNPRSLGSKRPKAVRRLWGEGSGPFRTVGRFSAAAIRGTTWLTEDQCTGTLTRVVAGSVSVRDFVRRKTVVVKAPRRYFARRR